MNVARKRRFWLVAGVLFAVLMIVFAAGAVFLAAQLRWIQERHAYLAAHPPMPVVVVADQAELVDDEPPSDILFSGTLVPEPDTTTFPRFVLWMLGEAEVGEFDLRFTLDDSAGTEVDRVRELFPESTIRWSILAP